MFRFAIRELVLLTVIVGLGVAWWLNNYERTKERLVHRELQDRHSALVDLLETTCKMKVEFTPISVIVEDSTGTITTTAWQVRQ